jgi:predicted RNase H-like HicB family nuclease
MSQQYTVLIEKGEDGYLISEVIELPGCHSQAKTHDELMKRTREVIELYLDEAEPTKRTFLGLQRLEI